MVLTGMLSAVREPLLRRAVLVPGIVARERLNRWHVFVVEDLVLFLKDGKRFLRRLILIKAGVSLGQEHGLFNDELVLLDDVGVTSR